MNYSVSRMLPQAERNYRLRGIFFVRFWLDLKQYRTKVVRHFVKTRLRKLFYQSPPTHLEIQFGMRCLLVYRM